MTPGPAVIRTVCKYNGRLLSRISNLSSYVNFNASKALFTQASGFSFKVSSLIQQPTNSVSKLFVLEGLQVFCPLILKSKPHKRHLPSFPDPTGLMGVRSDELSPNLRDCGVLGIV